jgi:hypothetical protein
MASYSLAQAGLSSRPRRAHGRLDPTARSVQLFVARAGSPQRELADAIAPEGRVCMAVDQPWDCAEAAGVDFFALRIGSYPTELVHLPDGHDSLVVAEDECALDDVDLAERATAKRRIRP